MHAWRQRILKSEKMSGERDLDQRRRFNAWCTTMRRLKTQPRLKSCTAVHRHYSKRNRKPARSTRDQLPSKCVRTRDGKVFSLPRLYSLAECRSRAGSRGFTQRASCAPFR